MEAIERGARKTPRCARGLAVTDSPDSEVGCDNEDGSLCRQSRDAFGVKSADPLSRDKSREGGAAATCGRACVQR